MEPDLQYVRVRLRQTPSCSSNRGGEIRRRLTRREKGRKENGHNSNDLVRVPARPPGSYLTNSFSRRPVPGILRTATRWHPGSHCPQLRVQPSFSCLYGLDVVSCRKMRKRVLAGLQESKMGCVMGVLENCQISHRSTLVHGLTRSAGE